jgi:hypothetical protein
VSQLINTLVIFSRKSVNFYFVTEVLYIIKSPFPFSIMLDLTNELDGGKWAKILTSTFFGTSDPITGRINDGRWKGAEVPRMTSDFLAKEGIDENTTFFPVEEEMW